MLSKRLAYVFLITLLLATSFYMQAFAGKGAPTDENPEGMYLPRRADAWIHSTYCDPSGDCDHWLVTWFYRSGHDQHYKGWGGDYITCIPTLGGMYCIDDWVWWEQYPWSKLGVPGTWLRIYGWTGANNANNYEATVWID